MGRWYLGREDRGPAREGRMTGRLPQMLTASIALSLATGCGDVFVGAMIDAPDFIFGGDCGSVYRSAEDVPLHVSLPKDADDDFDAVLTYAVTWWHEALPGLIIYDGRDGHPDDGDHITLRLVDVPIASTDVLATTSYQMSVSCFITANHIVVNFKHPGSDSNGHPAAEIVAHELGHALGLKHDNDPTSLMWPYAHRAPFQLLPETRQEMMFVYGTVEHVL